MPHTPGGVAHGPRGLAIRITAGLVASVEKANSLNVPDLAATEACPGPADGWSLWIVNPSERTYFIRARSGSATIVARVEPNSTRMAVGGFGETSTIELLDADCNVLSSLQRSGWGPFKGVIDEDSLRLEAGVSPVPTILSYGHVRVCGDA